MPLGEQLFRAGMYWRIIYGCLRIFLGSFLLTLIGTPAVDAYRQVMRHVIGRDPNDHIFGFIAHTLTLHGYAVTYFIVAYLFFWGAVDIFLSLAMLRHILWAFPLSIALIAGFILYEIYRYSHTHSDVLLAIIIIDLFLIYLIRREHRMLQHKIAYKLVI